MRRRLLLRDSLSQPDSSEALALFSPLTLLLAHLFCSIMVDSILFRQSSGKCSYIKNHVIISITSNNIFLYSQHFKKASTNVAATLGDVAFDIQSASIVFFAIGTDSKGLSFGASFIIDPNDDEELVITRSKV